MARDLLRDDVVHSSRTWVVKVGSSVLTGPEGKIDPDRIDHLTDQIAAIIRTGRRVALVSSGAVAAGMGRLGLSKRPDNLRQLQAAAAIGQANLIRAYDKGFARHHLHAAQLLLTHSDFDSRARYLNMRNTLTALFEYGAVPVINENDTISVAEIKFGDNDRLAAMVTNLLQAPLLIILSVVDGLLTQDPAAAPPDTPLEPIDVVRDLDDFTLGLAGDSKSALGTGGMRSKLDSVKLATRAGGSVIITTGRRPDPLTRILAGERVGTLFLAQGRTEQARRRWIGGAARPRGYYIVDPGARTALERAPTSLLPIGVVGIEGEFEKGDVVGIRDGDGREFARGLTNYPSPEARKIAGQKTERLRTLLGTAPYDEVIHRDNLVLLG
jgi:glutamate 5-kinase